MWSVKRGTNSDSGAPLSECTAVERIKITYGFFC